MLRRNASKSFRNNTAGHNISISLDYVTIHHKSKKIKKNKFVQKSSQVRGSGVVGMGGIRKYCNINITRASKRNNGYEMVTNRNMFIFVLNFYAAVAVGLFSAP